MDLKHGDDIYDSFRTYQNKLLREYSVDGRRVPLPGPRRPPIGSITIQDELRKQVAAFLEPTKLATSQLNRR